MQFVNIMDCMFSRDADTHTMQKIKKAMTAATFLSNIRPLDNTVMNRKLVHGGC